MAYEARIIADSICNGQRLTTMQVTHPKCVHQDFLTHSMFARNADSSRAIPFETMLKRLVDDPFIPRSFGKNQKGMQAGDLLTAQEYESAVREWLGGRDEAIVRARRMAAEKCVRCAGAGCMTEDGPLCTVCGGHGRGLNIHKQDVNRLLEPWMWITLCVTGMWEAWSNYFALRCHPDADPKIQPQAYMAQLAYFRSQPREIKVGDWHTPYITPEDADAIPNHFTDPAAIRQISAGRCARTSYTTQEGVRDYLEDIRLHDRLKERRPLHASPFAHVCVAMGDDKKYAMFTGWKAYRHMIPGEYVTDFQPNHPELIAGDR